LSSKSKTLWEVLVRFGLALALATTSAIFAAPQSFAASAASTFYAAGHAAQSCAAAAASAQKIGNASDASLAACSTAIRMAGDSDARLAAAYTNRAILHLMRAEYQDSVADSDSALKIDNQLSEALVNRGVAMLLQHRPNDAAADFTRALSLAPSNEARVYFNRAMAREDSGDLRGAYADYSQAARLEPKWDRPKQELSRFTVAPKTPVS
jgi:tetratricopeptide (TPR) repeat protein